MSVSTCTDINQAILYTSDPALFVERDLKRFETLQKAVSFTRYSHDCYAAGLLAMGQIDVLIEYNVHPYDIAAMIPLIERAGGVISDWQGKPLQLSGNINVLSSATPALHQKLIKSLN